MWQIKCDQCPWIKEGTGCLLPQGGFHKFKMYADCRTKEGTECLLPRGGFHKSKMYADCSTIGLVYLVICLCGTFYIGKTKRPFAKGIQDHLYYLDAELLYTPICKYIGLNHSFVSFFALEVIPEPERGGDFNKKILQQENKWIFNQRATYPPGLNTALSFKPFL